MAGIMAMHLPRLTRRAALVSTLASAWTLIVNCSGPQRTSRDSIDQVDEAEPEDPSPSPTDSTSPLDEATSTEGKAPTSTVTAEPSPSATVQEQRTPATEGPFIPTEPKPVRSEPREIRIPYAVVTSRKLQVRNVSYAEAVALWRGEIQNWSALGDPLDTPVRRYSIAGSVLPIDPFGGDVSVDNYDDLAESLWYDRGGIALVPTQMLDFRVRTLTLDGVDILRRPEEPNPLTLQLFGVPEEVAPETLEPRETPVLLTFVGDIIFGRFVHKTLEALGDFAASFRSVADELQIADLTIGDLECVLSDNFPQPENENPQTFLFKTWTETVSGLQLANIDVLARANNHSFNFGAQGMQDTTDTLDQAGILHFGMGHTLAESRKPVIVEVNGLSFAFLGYNGISDIWDGATDTSAGTAPLIDWMVIEDIQNAVAAGHIVIPYFHWGIEYVSLPTDQQRYFAQIAIDTGAAAVIGSHPHWVQAVETYQNKAIIYSLGNFVFDQSWSRETQEGVYANIWFEGSTVKNIDLVAVLIEQEHRPRRMSEAEALPVLDRIWEASETVRGWA
jgi:poly-gamma-glutamate synthesis protein (capsule biosynthesis protein)